MYSLILHGRRLVQLQKRREFIVSVKLLQNSFSSAAAAAEVNPIDVQNGKKLTVSYLVDSLGLTRKLAESISRKVSSEGKGDPDSVLNLLKSHGFTDSQISSIITDYPLLLIADVEKSLGPKLQFLQSRGASTSELTEILSKVPKILGKTGEKTMSVYYDFVKEIIEADKSSKYVKLSHSLPQGCKQENKIRNLSALRELGMPQKNLFPLLISGTRAFCGKENFDASLKKVVEMGFDPTTTKFVLALRVVNGFRDNTIEEKIVVYEKLGFTVGDVWEMFKKNPSSLAISEKKILNSIEIFLGLGITRDEFAMMVKRYPQCIGLSAATIKKKTEFLLKKMNWPLQALVSNPAVLGYNLEKRTLPRCKVIKALMSKGLLGSELPVMSSVLLCTDDAFLNRYVRKHDDKQLVAELMAILFTRDCAS